MTTRAARAGQNEPPLTEDETRKLIFEVERLRSACEQTVAACESCDEDFVEYTPPGLDAYLPTGDPNIITQPCPYCGSARVALNRRTEEDMEHARNLDTYNDSQADDEGDEPEATDFPVFRQNVINLCFLVLPVLEKQMTREGDPDFTPDAQVAQAYTRTLAILEFLDALPERYQDAQESDDPDDMPF